MKVPSGLSAIALSLYLPANTAGHVATTTHRQGSYGRALPTRWMIYAIASRQTWIGEIDAANETEAIKRAAEKFNLCTTAKLMAVRRGTARSSA
jgi:hypothetical protein